MIKFINRFRKKKESEDESQDIPLAGYKLKNERVGREKAFKQRQKEIRRQQRRNNLKSFWINNGNKFFVGFVSFLLVFLLSLLVIHLHSSKTYIIQEFIVKGNNRISEEEVLSKVTDLLGGSMLAISNRTIEDRVSNEFVYLKDVTVSKILPGVVEIDINERSPEVVFVNLSGIYLLDSEGIVVNIMHERDIEGLTEEQAQIVAGMGDGNSQLIKELYLGSIEDPEERDEVVWEDVPLDEKLVLLEELRLSLESLLEDQLAIGIDIVEQSAFAELLRVYSFESNVYAEGDEVSNYYYFDYPIEIRDELEIYEGVSAVRFLWQSKFMLRVDLSDDKFLLFSSQDSIDWQLRKFSAVIENEVYSEGTLIDLRGEKIVIR